MKIKPIYDRVVVKPIINETKTVTGIVLPETSQSRPQIGVVVEIGDGTTFDGDKIEMKVKVGDKILFNRYAGTEIKLGDENFLVLRQIDVIGVFDD